MLKYVDEAFRGSLVYLVTLPLRLAFYMADWLDGYMMFETETVAYIILVLLAAVVYVGVKIIKHINQVLEQSWGITWQELRHAHFDQFAPDKWFLVITTYDKQHCFSHHIRRKVLFQGSPYDELCITFVGNKPIDRKYSIITGHGLLRSTRRDSEDDRAGTRFSGPTELSLDCQWVYSDELTHITLLSPLKFPKAKTLE